MSMPPVQIVYEIHSTVLDIELLDTRRRGYRTASGRLRPFFTFVFAPVAQLALAFSLSADRPERQTIAALLYAAMMQPPDQLNGGIPNEVWLYEGTASFASSLRRLCEDLGIPLRCLTSGLHSTGEAERFLTEYHRSANSETEQSPLVFWQMHCFPSSAEPHRLARLLGEGIPRAIESTGLPYYLRWYWHDELASLPPGTEVLIYPTPSLSMPESVEVFIRDTWICTALVSRRSGSGVAHCEEAVNDPRE